MRGALAPLLFVASVAVTPAARANSPPVVSNVTAQQVAGTGNVRITFDVSDADGDQVTARVICSSNNGVTFDLLPVTLSGDVNQSMSPGFGKQIIWNASADYPGRYWGQVVARVYASDGPALSGEMVSVAAGSFTMGKTGGYPENQPEHTVSLAAYSIDKYEVTNAEFQRFIDAGGYTTEAFWSAAGWAWRTGQGRTTPDNWGVDSWHSGPGWPGFPVVGVSWYEAEAYANFVGKRLPTEAEWERAARGSDERSYPWGEVLSPDRANSGNDTDPFGVTTPVGFYNGQLFPNPPFQTTDSPGPYNTYDQAGNVAEWVSDWFGSYASSPSSNPTGPPTGIYKVIRGASWLSAGSTNDPRHDLRSFVRYYLDANNQSTTPGLSAGYIGFRCARSGP
jgi:formylglycine-generating enzyme required for sulfatase activity